MLFPILCILALAMGIVVGMWTFAHVFNDQPKRKVKKQKRSKKRKKSKLTVVERDETPVLSDEYYSQMPEEEAYEMQEQERKRQTEAYNYARRAEGGAE